MVTEYIFIEQLAVPATVGVYEWEQRIKQKLLIDLEVQTAFAASTEHDDIDQTLSYAWLAEQITDKVQSYEYALLESIISDLGDWLATLPAVQAYELVIRKPGAVNGARNAGVRQKYQRAAVSDG